jgi:hypothetical protein
MEQYQHNRNARSAPASLVSIVTSVLGMARAIPVPSQGKPDKQATQNQPSQTNRQARQSKARAQLDTRPTRPEKEERGYRVQQAAVGEMCDQDAARLRA